MVNQISLKSRILYLYVPLGIITCFAFVVRSTLPMFIVAFIVAYIFNPLINRLQQKMPKVSRTWWAIGFTVVFYIALTSCFLFLVPLILKQSTAIVQKLPEFISFISKKLSINLPEQFHENFFMWDNVVAFINEHIQNFMNASAKIINVSMKVVNVISVMFLTPIITFYILVDWNKMADNVRSLIPSYCKRDVIVLMKRIDYVLSAYLRGQLNVCLLIIVYYAITLFFLGLDYFIILAFVNALLLFLPYIGVVVSYLLTSAVAIMQWGIHPVKLIIIALIFILCQFVEGNFITPNLVGNKVNIHPFWIIFAVFVGADLAGFIGILVAMPLASILGVLIRFFLDKYRKRMIGYYGELH